jgi:hypothetical protein
MDKEYDVVEHEGKICVAGKWLDGLTDSYRQYWPTELDSVEHTAIVGRKCTCIGGYGTYRIHVASFDEKPLFVHTLTKSDYHVELRPLAS